jgi:hypothetical protein
MPRSAYGRSSSSANLARNAAAGTPSTTRWSKLSDSVHSVRASILPSTTAGLSAMRPTPRMAV